MAEASSHDHPASPRRIRVLVVERNRSRRESLVVNLRQRDYLVNAAEGSGLDLLKDAQDKVMAQRCHVVVVAPRLLDPNDPNDFSGLELARSLAPASVIIYSPYADDRLAFRAGDLNLGYVRDSDPLETLFQAVEKQVRKYFQSIMSVAWPGSQEDFARYVAQHLKMEAREVQLDYLYDLLGRVFEDAIALDMKPLPSLNTIALVNTPVRHAVVLWTRERRRNTNVYLTPKVVKISRADRVQREVENYKRYVEGWVSQNQHARLEGAATLWHLGALAYAFLGATPEHMVTFRQYYAHNSPDKVLGILQGLFLKTFDLWYHEQQVKPRARLFDLYNTPPLQIQQRIEERLDTTNHFLSFPDHPMPLPNPAIYALRDSAALEFSNVTLSIVHGDLHGDNFFVDSSNLAWLIDFEHTGPAHALRDFVELEADIKLRLTGLGDDDQGSLGGLAALEGSLLTGRSLSGLLLPDPAITASPPLQKAFLTICGLRHLAYLATGINDSREYLHALLYETLFMATLNRLSKAVRRRAWFSAALIAEKLTRRTGLLGGMTPIPYLDIDAMDGDPQASERMQAHVTHLQACYRAAKLQESMYQNPTLLPVDLKNGLASLLEEARRAQKGRQKFNLVQR